MILLRNFLKKGDELLNIQRVIIIVQVIFFLGILRQIDLPGLYFDEAGVDYLATRFLNPSIDNPLWIFPTNWLPFLGTLYGGVPGAYVDVPIFGFFGTNIFTVRMSHALTGGLILFAIQVLIFKVSKKKYLTLMFGLLLATSPVYLTSFRSLAMACFFGLPFTILAFYLLYDINAKNSFFKRKLLLAGALTGFACYAYFVYFIFIPLIVFFLVLKTKEIKSIVIIFAGWVVGFLPYFLGIYLMFEKQGSLKSGLDWIRWAISVNKPIAGDPNPLNRIKFGLDQLGNALFNIQPEVMVLGKSIFAPSVSNLLILGLLIFTTLIPFLFLFISKISKSKNQYEIAPQDKVILLLPWIYLSLLSSIFGSRLAVWHILPTLPLLYVSLALASYQISRVLKSSKMMSAMIFGILLIIMPLNFVHQNLYFKELSRSGGVGMNSSSLNDLASEGLRNSNTSVYFFPDWGFWTSFATLTDNRVRYELNVTTEIIQARIAEDKNLSIVFWKSTDSQRYMELLQQAIPAGFNHQVKDYTDRNGNYVFREIIVSAKE
jgi:hypothetical protein